MLASEGLSDLPFNLAFIYLFFCIYLFIYFYRKLFVVAVQP